MILTYHGGECVRASAGDTTLVFGPVSKKSKNFKPANFGTDIALVSLNHPDMNGAEEVGRGNRQPFVITGPGEYELRGVTVAGFPSVSFWGGEERTNTVYAVHFDGLFLIYLGALARADVPKELHEMDSPDVLVMPIGGGGVLSPADAQKVAVALEAKIVVPVHYDDKSLKIFLKEAGEDSAASEEKLTIKKKDVLGKENEVVILRA